MESRIHQLKNQLKKIIEKDSNILTLIDKQQYKEALDALPVNSRPILCELLKSLPEIDRDEIISLQDQFGIMWGVATDSGRYGTTAEIGQGENNIYSVLWTNNQGRKGGRQIGFKDLEEAEAFISKSDPINARVSLMSSPTVLTYRWVQVMTSFGKVWITNQAYSNVRNIIRTPLQEKEKELRKLQATSRYLKKFTPEKQIRFKNDDRREVVYKDFNNRLNKIKLNIMPTIIKEVLSKLPPEVAKENEAFLINNYNILRLFCNTSCDIHFYHWYRNYIDDKYQVLNYINSKDVINQIFNSLQLEIIKEFKVDSCSFDISSKNIYPRGEAVTFNIITTPSFSDLIEDQVVEVSEAEAASIETEWNNKVNDTNRKIELIKQEIKQLKLSNP